MPYKLAIFDFDGTLANTLPWFAGVLNDVADQHGFRRVKESEYDILRSLNGVQVLKYLSIPPLRVPLIGAYLHRRMAEEIDTIELVEGTAEVLRELASAGILLAVVSSNAAGNVRHVLGEDLASLVTAFQCGVSVFGKPPKLRHVLRACGVPRKSAIYLGDEIRDIEAAHVVGMASGAVGWGYNSVESFKAYEPTVIFTSVGQIVPAIVG
jgi:phosphoglycolate phosphatase